MKILKTINPGRWWRRLYESAGRTWRSLWRIVEDDYDYYDY